MFLFNTISEIPNCELCQYSSNASASLHVSLDWVKSFSDRQLMSVLPLLQLMIMAPGPSSRPQNNTVENHSTRSKCVCGGAFACAMLSRKAH